MTKLRVHFRVDAGVEVEGDFFEEADAAERGNGDTEWYCVDFGGGSQAAGKRLGTGGQEGGEESENEWERLCRMKEFSFGEWLQVRRRRRGNLPG